MMSLEDALALVIYAFQNGAPGDLFVQKAPATTIGTLAAAVQRVFGVDVGTRILGTRHGEKLYETLLTREEMVRASDLGAYYRVEADVRDLNYAKYYSQGEDVLSAVEDYHSHNTRRLGLDAVVELLRGLTFIQAELARGEGPYVATLGEGLGG
jgi:UDP-N-acetylglucosamine 4,6-dehydratase/5-epimerase